MDKRSFDHPVIRLNNGVNISALGLGVYQAESGRETERAVLDALDLGYRHIDTAKAYGNEKDVGRAIKKSGIPREEVFITTKLWNTDHGYDQTKRAFDESRSDLGVDYIDLYLIHWPVEGLRGESWRAMVELLERGDCRSIGVSNYTINHLEELLASSSIVPAVNQVEFSPFLYQRELLRFCRQKGIQLEAYSPLTQGKRLDHPTLVALARKHGKTPAQILIRWAIEHDLVVIPKSVRRSRIEENADVFDFSIVREDMALLDSLDEGFRTCWDPTDAP
ncbi:MAG TPA: aldo/keto reductase [Blastocatellia bacterium]|nr:aldo/keto reductase [Blastocatellia bacterium]